MVKQTRVVSMRLPSSSGKRLEKMARRHGWTVSDTSARLVEEGLRRSEFSLIDFRDSPVGRQAYILGSSLAVWEVMMVARAYRNNIQKTADHLDWPDWKVEAAFTYAKSYSKEIQNALADADAIDLESLRRILPNIEVFDAKGA